MINGDKLLCNRCLLKHEAQERERGEMLYKNTYSCRRESARKNLHVDTTDISITCSLGMGAAIQKTYEEVLWYGRSHPVEETMMIRGMVVAILKDSGMDAAIHQ